MSTPALPEVPKFVLQTLNHLYEIERKLALHGDPGGATRNVQRIKEAFSDEGIFFEDPMGQPFSETRSDLEASIAGSSSDNLVVSEVIKPIIRYGKPSYSRVIQKGIVVVKSSS